MAAESAPRRTVHPRPADYFKFEIKYEASQGKAERYPGSVIDCAPVPEHTSVLLYGQVLGVPHRPLNGGHIPVR